MLPPSLRKQRITPTKKQNPGQRPQRRAPPHQQGAQPQRNRNRQTPGQARNVQPLLLPPLRPARPSHPQRIRRRSSFLY